VHPAGGRRGAADRHTHQLLVGAILAFVGAVQLQQFGAAIYVANLVGVAMVREMGAMMTAIVMAGRTGASYAAQLGSMKVNQEIDALATTGIDPLEFLVLPRMIALSLMMPLLCLYADVLGILGGAAVASACCICRSRPTSSRLLAPSTSATWSGACSKPQCTAC